MNKKDMAHEICNTLGVVDNYPDVYNAAYQILYKGKLTNKMSSLVRKMQGEDVRKLNYVPIELLNNLNSIIG